MERINVKVGLFEATKEYGLFTIRNFQLIIVTILFISLVGIPVAILQNDFYIQIIVNVLYSALISYAILYIISKISGKIDLFSRNTIIITAGLAIGYCIINFGLSVLNELLSNGNNAFIEFGTAVVDIVWANLLIRLIIFKRKRYNSRADNWFMVKYCILYGNIRLLIMLMLAYLLGLFVPQNIISQYIIILSAISKIILLPIIYMYYEIKQKREIEYGNSVEVAN